MLGRGERLETERPGYKIVIIKVRKNKNSKTERSWDSASLALIIAVGLLGEMMYRDR